MSTKITFEFNIWQKIFMRALAPYQCLSGEFGSGKTSIAGLTCFKILQDNPGTVCVILRNFKSDLESATIPQFKELIFGDRNHVPNSVYWHSTKKHMIFPNNSEIWFLAIDNPAHVKKLKSLIIGLLWIDQAEEIDELIWTMACKCVRQPGTPQKRLLTCNPEGGDHWIKSLFYVNELNVTHDQINGHSVHYGFWRGIGAKYLGITGKPKANAANLPKDYYDELEKVYPNDWIEKYIYGNWFGRTGVIYSLSQDCIYSELPYFPYGVERFEGNDYGISETSPMVWLNIFYSEGVYYIDSCFYEFNSSIGSLVTHVTHLDISSDILSTMRVGCNRAFQVESGNMQSVRDDQKITPASLLAESGVVLEPYRIFIDVRRTIIQSLLKNGNIRINENCQELLKELRGLKYSTERTAPQHAIEAMERSICKHNLQNRERPDFNETAPKNKRELSNQLVNSIYMNEIF